MRIQDNTGGGSHELQLGPSASSGIFDGVDLFRVGVFCAACLRKHGATTPLAILEHSSYPDGAQSWRWTRVGRSGRAHRGLIQFARPSDGSSSQVPRTGGVELMCQRCGARPRLSFARLTADADAARISGVSAVNV